jgi:hypothetical protein
MVHAQHRHPRVVLLDDAGASLDRRALGDLIDSVVARRGERPTCAPQALSTVIPVDGKPVVDRATTALVDPRSATSPTESQ